MLKYTDPKSVKSHNPIKTLIQISYPQSVKSFNPKKISDPDR